MALFAISDPHLSLASDKPMDIFRGWEGYVDKLSANWRNMITDSDTVVIPGDISWEMKLEKTLTDFKFLDSLPGRKIILKGNHDLWWESVTKMNMFFSENDLKFEILHNNCLFYGDFALCGSRGWIYDDRSDDAEKVVLREAARIERSLEAAKQSGKESILFLHYPPVMKDSRCEEIMSVICKYGVKRCYYGHIHRAGSAKAINGTVDGTAFRCVSCDILDFSPLKIAD